MNVASIVKKLENVVHQHIDIVGRAKRALAKARKGGSASQLEENAKKLMMLGDELEEVLKNVEEIVSRSLLDPDSRERIELLLFFLYEVSLVEEEEFWRRLSSSKGRVETLFSEVADSIASRRRSMRREVLELLEKVKSLTRNT